MFFVEHVTFLFFICCFFFQEKEGLTMDKLREESRRLYLAKRKDDKLEELRRVVIDDETLFAHEE